MVFFPVLIFYICFFLNVLIHTCVCSGWSVPNATQKWQRLPLLGIKSLAPNFNFVSFYMSKTVENKNFNQQWHNSYSKVCTHRTLKQSPLFKAKYIYLKTYLSAVLFTIVMLLWLNIFISLPKFESCIRPCWLRIETKMMCGKR